MSDRSAEFLQIFRDESNLRLDRMTDALLALETGNAATDTVDSLFRDAHSIKGGAGMLELNAVHTLADAVEDVLARARKTQSFPVELADPLLRATDRLRAQVAGTADGGDDLVDELGRAQAAFVAVSPAPAVVPVNGPGEVTVEVERRTLRVPARQIDQLLESVGEAIVHQRGLEYQLDGVAEERPQVGEELDVVERLLDDLKVTAIEMRTLPLSSIVGPLPRMFRDLALAAGKEADLVVIGERTPLDRVILETLADLLGHLLRNAVGHGLETPEERRLLGKAPRGHVELRAEQRGGFVDIVVSDDGRGVTAATLEQARQEGGSLVDILARPGYSTAGTVTALSGRGVGLDVVKTRAESFGGSIEVRSEPGAGTTVVLKLPLALSLLSVLLVERGANVFGVPLPAIQEVVTVEETRSLEGRAEIRWRDRSVPLFDIAALVGATVPDLRAGAPALILTVGGRRAAASCDALLGEEEVVVKQLGSWVGRSPYLGAAILGDGRIALLLEPAALVRGPRTLSTGPSLDARAGQKVLVVEDSFTVRELQRSILEAAGYRVVTARDGNDALAILARDAEVALVLTDVDMPELDGLGLTRAIRGRESLAALPVIVVTSQGGDDDRRLGIEAGADAYMTKQSFDQRTLLDTIERLIGPR